MAFASTAVYLSSPAFQNKQHIPVEYTCDGANISPPLVWSAGPEGTKSYVLICEDPDAPSGVFTHWVLFNIPAGEARLAEAQSPARVLPNGAKHGTNDFGHIGYGGPRPPTGTHRYCFTLYALDTDLKLDAGVRKDLVLNAMDGHILSQSQLIGLYKRERSPEW